MTERWRQVPVLATRYEVSDQGRVRRDGRVLVGGQWDGYRLACLQCDDGRQRNVAVHRLVMWAFVGPQAPGIHVRHLDGSRDNNVLSNLAYGTPKENVQDSLRHGTNAAAAKTHCSKGHPLSGDNLRVLSTRPRSRVCKECANATVRRWRAKQAAKTKESA